jgi:hypothetical protein
MAIYRGPGGAGDAVADTTNQSEAAQVAAAAAQSSATAAASSASTASSSSTAAASSASAASTSATNAASSASAASTSASNASTSATNASNSATTAGTSATNASNSATAAASSASNASDSATAAASSASAASTSASNASTSATNASNSATAASNSATAAAASYDSFDDRYLGAKSSAPATDNDGDALLTGALYYNTSVGQLYVWDGSQWDEAAFSVSGAVISFNTRTGAVTLSSSDVTTALGYTPVQTETDPVVGAITGIVKANGAGTISAAVSGTDYQAPLTAGTDYLAPSAIGVTVQGYDADTAKYDDVTANFTGTLQNSGSNVVVDSDIGSTVQAYNANTVVTDSTQTLTNKTISGADNTLTVDGTDAVGFRNTPVGSKSADYTAVLADSGKTILHAIADDNPRTFTIPANSSVAYAVGTVLTFVNLINTVTIAITTDTMYLAGDGSTGSRTLAAYGVASAVKVDSTTWVISGNGLT